MFSCYTYICVSHLSLFWFGLLVDLFSSVVRFLCLPFILLILFISVVLITCYLIHLLVLFNCYMISTVVLFICVHYVALYIFLSYLWYCGTLFLLSVLPQFISIVHLIRCNLT